MCLCRRAILLFLLSSALSVPAVQAKGKEKPDRPSGSSSGRLSFTITPREGPASGGTQVTLTLNGEFSHGGADLFCIFGEKTVPAQSYFTIPNMDPSIPRQEVGVLCMAPAGSLRSSVTVKLAVEGGKFWAGPRFYYHDPVGSVSGGPRMLLEDSSGTTQLGDPEVPPGDPGAPQRISIRTETPGAADERFGEQGGAARWGEARIEGGASEDDDDDNGWMFDYEQWIDTDSVPRAHAIDGELERGVAKEHTITGLGEGHPLQMPVCTEGTCDVS